MSKVNDSTAWEDLIGIVAFDRDDPRYDDAVAEIYSRIPRVTDYWRVVFERMNLKKPIGGQPDWVPSGVDDPREDTFLVRLLSNDGHYPVEPLLTESGLLAADKEIAWSAVFWPGVHPNDDSRVAWFRLQEVSFFGAVALSVNPDQGRAIVHTQTAPRFLHMAEGSSFQELFDRSREMATRLKGEVERHILPDRRLTPDVFECDVSETVEKLQRAIDRERSPVLLRGLSRLLMAVEMRRFPHLLEEMALSAIISREAALELLRRKLSDETGKRLKKADVLERIRACFPTGEPFVDVLSGDWDKRLLMVHPVNKFGEYWDPMLEYEECTDTLRHAIYLYRYLLLDEVWDPGVPEPPSNKLATSSETANH